MSREPLPPFSLFAPPYRQFLALDDSEELPRSSEMLRGVALIWSLDRGHSELHLERAAERPGGLPLMVLLPQARKIPRLRDRVLAVVEEARPQTVLPFHPRPAPEEMEGLLRRGPLSLGPELVDYLMWRGIYLDQETRRIIRKTAELSQEVTTLSALARGVYLSRRALGRRFKQRGLPVPSHWLQICRVLRAAIQLQCTDQSLFEIARRLGYPDGFTLSNQMERLTGVRPTVVRERLGWEWVAEAWLRQEWETGGLRVRIRDLPDRAAEAEDPEPGEDSPIDAGDGGNGPSSGERGGAAA